MSLLYIYIYIYDKKNSLENRCTTHIYMYICICIYIYMLSIYRQYTTEEGRRSVPMPWSFYYRFVALNCRNNALYLCYVYK